jgi:hypothetical protein
MLMKKLRFVFLGLMVVALVVGGAVTHAANISGGYTNAFGTQPSAVDWSTATIAGGSTTIGSDGQMDDAVQLLAAASITAQLTADANNPPGSGANGFWSSSGFYVQTRPTGNAASLVMCTLVNNLGVEVVGVALRYDFAMVQVLAEQVQGHRAYYSLSGAAGSWVVIPEFSGASAGTLTANLNVMWPSGGSLYLLWADDNADVSSPDTAMQIDNFSAIATPGVQVPVTITNQPQSQIVGELQPSSFTVGLAGYFPPTVQWYTNDVAIPGATNRTYSISSTPLAFSGLGFKAIAQNVASNVTYFATSTVATLTVNADLVAPVLLGASPAGLTTVVASFSEPLSLASVTNVANYSITNGTSTLIISNVVLDASLTNLIFTVSPMTPTSNYVLRVNGVKDLAAAGNTVAANSQAFFTAADVAYVDIGSPAVGGIVTSAGNGFNLTAGGTNILGNSDQFSFAYQPIAGDFDFKIRVASLEGADAWSLAGLMARQNLTANSPFAASLATPSISGCFFLQRSTVGANATFGNSIPANYPHTWLRLTRVGNVFTAYAGYDGQVWSQLGTVTIAMPASIFVGQVACGTSASGTATAAFRDYGPGAGGSVSANLTRNIEPPGPSTRRTALTITEIMYHQKPRADLRNIAFIEVFNSAPTFEDISGFSISGDVSYTFPPNTILGAGQFLVVAAVPSDIVAVYGLSGVHGPYTRALSQSSGIVQLRNRQNAIIVDVEYESTAPWPIEPDGAGHSLSLNRPSYGELDVRAWGASDEIGGSPGRGEAMGPEPLRNLVINEFLARTNGLNEDFIELYNYGTSPLNISGAWLSDSPNTNKFRVPDGTTLPARGYAVFYESQLGFGLSSSGEKIFLVNSNQNRVLDLWQFDAQSEKSMGRSPDGSDRIRELTALTPGASNAAAVIPAVVINEIMYDPATDNDDDEFIEIHNRSGGPVDISRWGFTDGIDYTFPSNTVMAAGAHFVVAKNKNRMISRYPGLNLTNLFGSYDGTLKNGGERVALARPDIFISTNNNGNFVTNIGYITVNELTYGNGGRWGEWSHGGGSSLELRDPDSDNHLAPNWGDSDETQKSEWTTVENVNGLLDNGQGAIDEIQIMLIGRGEALLDNVEVYWTNASINLVLNSGFESGTTGWFLGGNHIRSSQENEGEGPTGTKSLHLRASSGGDNGANRIEHNLSSTLTDGTRATMRAKFRWLRGNPHVLMKFHGNQLEASGILPVPTNLGSPGEPNSIRVTNAAPAIVQIAHAPVVPAASQSVVVSAAINDPDGVSSVTLRYRVDPAVGYTSVAMLDNGSGGDAVAGDGIYSGTIPGQTSGSLVAFYVQATDGTSVTATFPNNIPTRECHVRFGDPGSLGNLFAYRLWMTAANINLWTSRERLSNEPLDGTYVYGNFRAVYNAGGRYRGSPFLRPSYNGPTGNRCAYVWSLPEDEPILNTDELNLDSMEPADRDPTILRELTSFRIAEQLDLSFSYQRFVHVIVNGVTDTSRNVPAYADTQQPNGDYIDSWFPEENAGDIFKIDDWFEFNDTLNGPDREFNVNARLENFTTPAGALNTPGRIKKQARYRWSWEKKVLGGLDDDYSELFALVDALNSPDPLYTQQVEQYVDTEAWMTEIMVRHLVGDWDGYGYDRGKNTFAYKPSNGRWRLLLWDLDFSLGCSGGHPPTQNMFQTEDPTMSKMLNHPHFRRIYLRAMQRAVDGPLNSTNYLPLLEARFRALQQNGVVSISPFVGSGAQGISVPNWIDQRRANVLSQIPAANFAVNTPSFSSATNLVTVTGTAPVGIKTILINGVEWPVTWTSTTAWSVRLPLATASTPLNIVGLDLDGNVVTSTNTITATYTGTTNVSPVGAVVFNEILSNPKVPDSEYVELFNTSSNHTFNLSGWRINGLSYTFPVGSFIAPRSFVVLARDRVAFWTAFGYNVLVLDTYEGNLQSAGETLSLIRPAASTNETDLFVDRVRYEGDQPWPGLSAPGSSFQLVDASQENARVGNWYAQTLPPTYSEEISTPSEVRDGWRFFSATGNIGSGEGGMTNTYRLLLYLGEPGSALIDDLAIVSGSNAAVGFNYVRNGDFETPLDTGVTNSWKIGTNCYGDTFIASDLVHAGSGAFKIVGTNAGGIANHPIYTRSIMQVISPASVEGAPVTNTINTMSFWYWATNSATNLYVRIRGSTALATGPLSGPTNINIFITPSNYVPPMIVSQGSNSFSPGVANQFTTNYPAFQPLWINELQAENITGILDNNGEREPWIELYNTSTNTVSLDGLYLTDTYTNYTKWPFPPGSSIGPTQFLVIFCDGETGETSGSEYHTSFRLTAASGSVALSRLYTNAPQVLDYVNYAGLHSDRSYGSFPDGQPFDRQEFIYLTPGGPNDGRSASIVVYINEWMAQNGTALADPADGQFEDWFELYNPSTNAVDLAGFFLTDVLTNKFKFPITTNMAHIIPPLGYLLVWADNETGQNLASGVPRPDMHVNFALSQAGEALGLFAADGTQIDAITFGSQTNNISEGRFPDGAAGIYYMPISVSPRAPNYLPGVGNTPPVLSFIGSKIVYLGQTLAFMATATDSDVPAQILGFLLDAPVPPGAGIGPDGSFSWTPSTVGTNSVTVRVIDNGTPSLSDTETFTVEVLAAPSFTSSLRNGDRIELTWGTRAGKKYAVDYKNDLNAAEWVPLWTNVAVGSTLTFTNATTNAPQQFYRIRTVD